MRPEKAWASRAVCAAFALVATVPMARAQALIETSTLEPLSAWEVGAAEAGAAALPMSLWAGSNGATLAEVFAQLPSEFTSPSARSLAQGALLATSTPSQAGTFKALLERYEAIGRLGWAKALADMVRLSSQARTEPNLAVFAAQAELALHRPSEACRRTREAPPSLPILLKLRAFCVASAGDSVGTNVAIDVARSTGAADKFLYAALPVLSARTGAGPPARYDTALNAAVSVAARLRAPPQPLVGASNLALLHIALAGEASAPLRAEALAAGLARATLEPSAARPAALETLKAWPRGRGAPALPAWLAALRDVEAAQAGDRPGKIADLLARAPTPAQRTILARLFLPEILAGPNQSTAPANGLRLARSALVLGEVQAAQRWRAVLGAETSASSLATLDAALSVAAGGDTIEAARQRLGASAGDVDRALRDVRLLSMLAPLPPDLRALAPAPSAAPAAKDTALRAGLMDAADRGAAGETALRAAALLKGGPNGMDSATLAAIVQALQKVGLESAARAIIAEAILG